MISSTLFIVTLIALFFIGYFVGNEYFSGKKAKIFVQQKLVLKLVTVYGVYHHFGYFEPISFTYHSQHYS